MYDILTTAAIVDELADFLPGGRIQRVGLRDLQTVAFEIYHDRRRHHLVATIGDPEPAFYQSPDPFAIDPGLVTPFTLLLRKYVRGATLVALDQPPLERIVRLSIAKRFWPHNRAEDADTEDEDAEESALELDLPAPTFVYLAIELMGRRSNVILIDETGMVMDSLKRVTPKMSRVRPIWPSARYELPPERTGFDPRSLTEIQGARLLELGGERQSLGRSLVESVRGMSPAMAAEVCWRLCSTEDCPPASVDAATLAGATRRMVEPLESGDWAPSIYRDESGTLLGYAAVPFESLSTTGNEERASTMSAAVAAWQQSEHAPAGRHDGRRKRLLERIRERRDKVTGRMRSIEEQARAVAEADRLRQWGEAIYANLWEISQGQQHLLVDGESIPLDPPRAPKEVAAEYFERYRRMQRGTGEVEQQLEETRAELDYLDQLETMVMLATTFPEIEAVMAEWETYAGPASGPTRQKRKEKSDRVRPVVDAEGNQVYIGRTGPQNDRVTFDIGGPDDWWIHARGVPGSHVLVRGNGREPSEIALERAAAVAAWYSKSRPAGKVEVDLARRRDVRKIKGGGPGLVTYRNERTVLVSPADESTL